MKTNLKLIIVLIGISFVILFGFMNVKFTENANVPEVLPAKELGKNNKTIINNSSALLSSTNKYAVDTVPTWKTVESFCTSIKGETPYPGSTNKNLSLQAVYTVIPPLIDGIVDDSWKQCEDIYAWDSIAKINISLKALYDAENIYFLVRFADPDESREHKNWRWNKQEQLYILDEKREDVFVIKWSMEGISADLSIYADTPYRADIWFWKACRTDPAGYADDKFQTFSSEFNPKATSMISRQNKKMYLIRKGDKGQNAFDDSFVPVKRTKDILPYFRTRRPTGSRADIRAKGKWEKRLWTVEFARSLRTNSLDDVQLNISETYLLGVSRFEIAGRRPNPNLSQPLYGCGNVFNKIYLTFKK